MSNNGTVLLYNHSLIYGMPYAMFKLLKMYRGCKF